MLNNNELDKLCLKIDQNSKKEVELNQIKLLINYTINQPKGSVFNILISKKTYLNFFSTKDFVIQVLDKLKEFSYDSYLKLVIYLINLNK